MHFWDLTTGPLLYAHRGANRECPENTIEAFRRAIEQGADVLELDLHPTADGIFVVSHDDSGARNAGIDRRIGACNWSEVSTWDAGWGFEDALRTHSFRDKGYTFPRFDAVLDAFKTTPLNVDVKHATAAQLQRLLDLIRNAGATDRVLLTSFARRQLAALRRFRYEGAIGMSRFDVAQLVFSPESLSRLVGFAGKRVQVPLRGGPFDLSRKTFIEKCHRLGMGVDYWVVNSAEMAAELLSRGADGIVTDEPAVIATLFRSSPLTAAWRSRHEQRAIKPVVGDTTPTTVDVG